MDKIERGRVQEYSGDEFVIEKSHRTLVMDVLGDAVSPDFEEDSVLDLALIKITNVHRAIGHVRAARQAIGAPAPVQYPDDTEVPDLALDALVCELRAYFGHRYASWIPTMGKNRLMHGLQLFPYPNAYLPQPWDIGAPEEPDPVPPPQRADSDAGTGIRVGIIDTDMFENPALAGRYIADRDHLFGKTEDARIWWAGHATFVAGLILDRAPAAEVLIRSVMSEDEGTASLWDFARALAGFAGSGVSVVNCSMGCVSDDNEPPLALTRAIEALTPEVVVVAAAGNHGREVPADADDDQPASRPARGRPVWPAAQLNVLAVGARDDDGTIADFTPNVATIDGLGREPVPWIDFWAPGVEVQSTYLNGDVEVPVDHDPKRTERRSYPGWAKWSGTSFAAACLSGAIAANTSSEARTAREALDLLRGERRWPFGGGEPRSAWGIEPA